MYIPTTDFPVFALFVFNSVVQFNPFIFSKNLHGNLGRVKATTAMFLSKFKERFQRVFEFR